MEQYEKEVDLIEYLNVLWKRKWLIIVPTILLVLVAGIVSFRTPPAWEVDMLLQPGKFFVQTESGEFNEVSVTDPKQLASEINQGSRNRLISAEFNLDPRNVPKLKAENLRDTKLVRVSLQTGETEKGQAILNLLFQHLKSELDRKIDVEINNLNTQVEQTKNKILDLENEIKTRENGILMAQNEIKIRQNGIKFKELDIESRKIDKEKLTKEIESDKSRLKITEDRIADIYEELKSVKERIKELEGQQRKALAEPKEGTAAIALLLYSTEVQRNFQYSNSLDEKASAERLNRERITQDIQSKMDVLRQIDNQIDQVRTGMDSNRTEIETMKTGIENIKTDILKVRNNINNANNEIKLIEDKKNRIDYTQLIKEPTVSLSPVSPRKKRNVLIAGFLGVFCFSILALFLDYVKKGNIRLKTGS